MCHQHRTVAPDWQWARDLQPSLSTVPRLLAYLWAALSTVSSGENPLPQPKRASVAWNKPALRQRCERGSAVISRSSNAIIQVTQKESHEQTVLLVLCNYSALISPLLRVMLLKTPLLTILKAKCGDDIPNMTSIKPLHSPEAHNNPTSSATAENLFTLLL